MNLTVDQTRTFEPQRACVYLATRAGSRQRAVLPLLL